MHPFAMCPDCQREYEDPADRRFHAQPIACPACGPQLQLLDTQGVPRASTADALLTAAAAVRDGAILALKGLGGFQLIVDALNAQAVEQLRARKHRPHKPFAVMLPDLDAVRRYCHVSSLEERQLTAPEAPIVLLRKRAAVPAAATMAEAIAPGNPYLGVMLPNTPLHWLLLRHLQRPAVCTSGNRAEEPMATETLEALERLGDIADLVLTHDRTIVRPVDDSVCRVEDGSLQVLRRARGFAPTPIALPFTPPCVLAVGGHLKNCVALTVGDRVVVGSHVGDLDNTLSLEVHRRSIDDLLDFFGVSPRIIACDLHPDYVSTQHAERLAIRFDVPLARIQHHHAHVLSAIAEHQLEGPVLGLAWDGTGYGPDGTIWGGEALTVDGPHWERVAHVRAFPLVGGDRAAREPRRSALGVLYETGDRSCESFAACGFAPSELSPLLAALERPHLFPRTSSMGRLFDAVAALCGLGTHVTFEGQAAMQLEYVADADERGSYPMPIADSLPAVADWGPTVAAILEDRTHGTPVPIIAGRFHNSLARLAREIALRCNCPRIVLTGGCFQNRLLTHRTRHCLSEAGFAVYTQRVVPPGDGGIALGQVLGAYYQVGD
jgi:hydrogenase maturation protein HypF